MLSNTEQDVDMSVCHFYTDMKEMQDDDVCEALQKAIGAETYKLCTIDDFTNGPPETLQCNQIVLLIAHGHFCKIENGVSYFADWDADEAIKSWREWCNLWVAACGTGNYDMQHTPDYHSIQNFRYVKTIKSSTGKEDAHGPLALSFVYRFCKWNKEWSSKKSSNSLTDDKYIREIMNEEVPHEIQTKIQDVYLFPHTFSFPEAFYFAVYALMLSFGNGSLPQITEKEDEIVEHHKAIKKKGDTLITKEQMQFNPRQISVADVNEWFRLSKNYMSSLGIKKAQVSEQLAEKLVHAFAMTHVHAFRKFATSKPGSLNMDIKCIRKCLALADLPRDNGYRLQCIGVCLRNNSDSRKDNRPNCESERFWELVEALRSRAKQKKCSLCFLDSPDVTRITTDAADIDCTGHFSQEGRERIVDELKKKMSSLTIVQRYRENKVENKYAKQIYFLSLLCCSVEFKELWGIHSGFQDIMRVCGVEDGSVFRITDDEDFEHHKNRTQQFEQTCGFDSAHHSTFFASTEEAIAHAVRLEGGASDFNS